MIGTKKQDWTPREYGEGTRKDWFRKKTGQAWWDELRDESQVRSALDFQDWLLRRLKHHGDSRHVIEQIRKKMAMPGRKLESPEALQKTVLQILAQNPGVPE